MNQPEYIDNILICSKCGSGNKASHGKDWKCKDCNGFWRKKRKKNPKGRVKGCITWNKGLTKDDPRVAEYSRRSRETKIRLIESGKLDPTKNLPPKIYDISKEELRRLYWDKDMRQQDIAIELGCSQSLISLLMKKYGIRNRGHKEGLRRRDPEKLPEIYGKLSKALKGNTNWRFGGNFPNKQEKKVIDYLAKYGLPFRYVGDGSYLIEGKNPDFICEESRKIIEFFGELWHPQEHEQERIDFFMKCGWDCFVIWGLDIRNKKNRESLLERLLRWYFS